MNKDKTMCTEPVEIENPSIHTQTYLDLFDSRLDHGNAKRLVFHGCVVDLGLFLIATSLASPLCRALGIERG